MFWPVKPATLGDKSKDIFLTRQTSLSLLGGWWRVYRWRLCRRSCTSDRPAPHWTGWTGQTIYTQSDHLSKQETTNKWAPMNNVILYSTWYVLTSVLLIFDMFIYKRIWSEPYRVWGLKWRPGTDRDRAVWTKSPGCFLDLPLRNPELKLKPFFYMNSWASKGGAPLKSHSFCSTAWAALISEESSVI